MKTAKTFPTAHARQEHESEQRWIERRAQLADDHRGREALRLAYRMKKQDDAERTGIDWNDPADVAFLADPVGLSNRSVMLRNAEEARERRERALEEERPGYLRRCEQDEARIRQSQGNSGYFNAQACAAWMGNGNAPTPVHHMESHNLHALRAGARAHRTT